jgi:hypothetical protein
MLSRDRFIALLHAHEFIPTEVKLDLDKIAETLDNDNKQVYDWLVSGQDLKTVGDGMHLKYPNSVKPKIIGGRAVVDRLQEHFNDYLDELVSDYSKKVEPTGETERVD